MWGGMRAGLVWLAHVLAPPALFGVCGNLASNSPNSKALTSKFNFLDEMAKSRHDASE